MNYKELKKKHEEEASEFSKDKIYFVFGSSKEEVIEKLAEKGVKPEEVYSMGAGGYIKKEYAEAFDSLVEKQAKEKKEYALANVYEVVYHELANYEAEISLSYSYNDILTIIIGFTPEEIEDNKEEINKAMKDYREDFYKYN